MFWNKKRRCEGIDALAVHPGRQSIASHLLAA